MGEEVIDSVTFDSLVEAMGADFIGDLIDTYCEETPQLIAVVQRALAEGNADELRRAAHSIKSSSASFGVLSYSALAREVEMMGKEGNLAAARPKVERLAADYALVERTLRERQSEP
ncbi:MAG: Hpt domain-containing protein [Anaerolineales bacterium]|nr:Hpt domain-containing protein [Anaerolineales bacterium]